MVLDGIGWYWMVKDGNRWKWMVIEHDLSRTGTDFSTILVARWRSGFADHLSSLAPSRLIRETYQFKTQSRFSSHFRM